MPSLKDEKAVQKSKAAAEGGSGDDFVSLQPTGDTYLVLTSSDYEEAYEHWIPNPNKKGKDGKPQKTKHVCLGGVDGKGYAPEQCPACAEMVREYELKKAAKDDNDETLAKEHNDRGNSLRAGYKICFLAAKGEAIKERNAKTGKLMDSYSFDKFDGKARIISFTAAQWQLLLKVPDSGKYPTVTSMADLVGRVLKLTKTQNGKKTYLEVTEITPLEKIKLNVTSSASLQSAVKPSDAKEIEKSIALFSGGEEAEENYGNDDDADVDPRQVASAAHKRTVAKAPVKKSKK